MARVLQSHFANRSPSELFHTQFTTRHVCSDVDARPHMYMSGGRCNNSTCVQRHKASMQALESYDSNTNDLQTRIQVYLNLCMNFGQF
jgi:hypothetical protein